MRTGFMNTSSDLHCFKRGLHSFEYLHCSKLNLAVPKLICLYWTELYLFQLGTVVPYNWVPLFQILTPSCFQMNPSIPSLFTSLLPTESRVGIHKQFGARKKTGSELIFLRIDFKIRFFLFLQMQFTKNVSVWQISSERLIFLEKNWSF